MSYVVGPLHLLLFIPFIHIGESLFGVEHTLLSVLAIKNAFIADWLDAIFQLSFELFCGLSGWALVAVPLGFLLYLIIWKTILLFSQPTRKNEK